ncbi:MAG TPA: hypothetical protein VF584_11655 [Longimicrobium sp.]|jgi:hypothetical protein
MADQRVLRVFTKSGGQFEVVLRGDKFVRLPRPEAGSDDLEGLTRILVYDRPDAAEPAFAFDAVPLEARLSHVHIRKGGREALVMFGVRCALRGGAPLVILELELRKDFHAAFLKVRDLENTGPEIFETVRRLRDIPAIWEQSTRRVPGRAGAPVEPALGVRLEDSIRVSLGRHPGSSEGATTLSLQFERDVELDGPEPLPFRLQPGAKAEERKGVQLVQRPCTAGPLSSRPETACACALELRGLRDRWVFEAWNRHVVRPYLEGLHTVQSGRPMSLLPRWKTVQEGAAHREPKDLTGKDAWMVLGRLEEGFPQEPRIGREARTRWSLQPARQIHTLADLPGFVTHEGAPFLTPLRLSAPAQDAETVLAEPSAHSMESVRLLRFAAARVPPAAGASVEPQTVRVGALDLGIDPLPQADAKPGEWLATVSFRPGGAAEFRRSLPIVDLTAVLRLATVEPGAQDPLPGEEFVAEDEPPERGGAASGFRRRLPLVIPHTALEPEKADPSGGFVVEARERTLDAASQTITLNLKRPEDAETPEGADRAVALDRILVIDTEPFLVARVEVPPLLSPDPLLGAEIGNWSNRSPEGAGWELRARAGGFTLVLPPQGVGEEMERSENSEVLEHLQDIAPNEPADFRFSPPARFRLLASFFRQNFAEAPWNLRRILGFPGQRAPGAGVVDLSFELLYGMACRVDAPFLRLAELAALLGAPAGRLPPSPADADLRAAGKRSVDWIKLYGDFAARWTETLRLQRARIGLLEPWSAAQPAGLVLREGVECRLRATAQLRFPGDPERIENPALRDHATTGLAGGVAWPFESTNIYNAVWRVPTSDEAEVAQPRFSALGGWGSQKVSFDNRRTTIHASVAMGRTFYQATERIGRIGVFWNRAKHVVIYERTVRRADQFSGDQDELAGRPVLRKVREYVEILETDRRYPESGAAPAMRGFVLACSFPPHARIINVNTRWGRDVGDIGWAVPLWDPAEARAKPEVYPRPEVLLEVAADPESGAPTEKVRIEDPHKLVFYTDTRAGTDSRTDLWEPVWGVDYLDLLQQVETLPESDASLGAEREDAEPVRSGHDRFTYAVAPSPRGVNLVAERAGRVLGAVIANVTMMRAPALRLPEKDPEDAKELEKLRELKEFVEKEAALSDLTGDVAGAFDPLLARLAETGRVEEVAKLLGQAKARLERVRGAVGKLQGEAPDLCRELGVAAQGVFDGAAQTIRPGLSRFRGRLLELLGGLDPATWREEAPALIDRAFDELDGFLTAKVAVLDLKQLPPGVDRALADFEEAAGRWVELADAMKEAVETAADPDALRKEARRRLDELERRLQREVQRLDAAAAAVFGGWSGGRLDRARAALLGIGRSLQVQVRRVDAAIATVTGEPAKLQAAVLEALAELRQALDDAAKAPRSAVEDARARVRALADNVQTWPEAARAELHALVNALPNLESLQGAVARLLDDDSFADVLARWRGMVGKRAMAACSALVPPLTELADLLVIDDVEAALERLVERAPEELRELRDGLVRLRDSTRTRYAAYAEQARGAIAAQRRALENRLPKADGALRLVRAFGDAPRVPGLGFNRRRIEYWFDEAARVTMTPVVARVRTALDDAGARLEALGTQVPTRELAERLLPAGLESFSLSRVFPRFAGLQLDDLFPGLRLPGAANQGVQITHGVDRQSLRAWVDTEIDVPLADRPATLFSIGPVTVRLLKGRFRARARVEAGPGRPPAAVTTGAISGDWELAVGGMVLAVFRDTALAYDESGHLRFGISPEKVELQAALRFLSQLMDSFGYSGSGFAVGLLPLPQIGVRSLLDLPLPDVQFGAFGIANLRLSSSFVLRLDGGFRMDVSLAVARKTAPFTLTVFILGGGGWLEATASYAPSTGKVETRVTIGIVAGASLRIALGPIRGGVWVTFGIYAEFQSGAGGGLTVGFVLVIGGEVCLAGIVTVSILLRLEARYGQDGSVVGLGTFSAKIKICWCFTLEIRKDIEYVLVSGGQGAARRSLASAGGGDAYDHAAEAYLNRFEKTSAGS